MKSLLRRAESLFDIGHAAWFYPKRLISDTRAASARMCISCKYMCMYVCMCGRARVCLCLALYRQFLCETGTREMTGVQESNAAPDPESHATSDEVRVRASAHLQNSPRSSGRDLPQNDYKERRNNQIKKAVSHSCSLKAQRHPDSTPPSALASAPPCPSQSARVVRRCL